MSCEYRCKHNGIACPRPITCAAHTVLHVRNGGHAVDTDFGHSRIELPQPTEPVGELDQWAARLSRRAVFFLLALAAGAFAIGYFSR